MMVDTSELITIWWLWHADGDYVNSVMAYGNVDEALMLILVLLFQIYLYRVYHSVGTVLPWGPVWYKSMIIKTYDATMQ